MIELQLKIMQTGYPVLKARMPSTQKVPTPGIN